MSSDSLNSVEDVMRTAVISLRESGSIGQARRGMHRDLRRAARSE